MESLMVDRVQSSLRNFMIKNAIFVCERLCAEFPSEPNLQLMATCYLRNNQAYCAYHILKGKQMPQSRYLFAFSCFQMKLLREAEAALCPVGEPNSEVPNGAAGHYLLGLVYRYTSRRKSAVDHFMQALSIDPLLWSAYEELCVLGAAENANECFGDSTIARIRQQYISESCSQNVNMIIEDQSVPSTKFSGSRDSSSKLSRQIHANNLRDINVIQGSGPSSANSFNLSQYNTPPTVIQLSGVAPPPLFRNAHQHLNANAVGADGSSRLNANAANQARRRVLDDGKIRKVSGRLFSGSDSGLRRSTRLSGEASNNSQVGGNGANHSSNFFGGISLTSKTKLAASRRKAQQWASENIEDGRQSELFDDSRLDSSVSASSSTSSYGSTYADHRSSDQDGLNIQTSVLSNESKLTSGIVDLLSLFKILGEGYRLSCLYKSQDALEVYMNLPQRQFKTGWVLCQVGKAYYEMVDHIEADRIFDMARQVSPCTFDGMDIYSTLLFHLKKDMKLSYLAQDLISIDRLSPQAWCAMGNCYSLLKDHETALKNFLRAVQLDSRFAYAHTLCGHEYVAMEDFDNGIKCYQYALEVDDRHYNAWYGLGVVYLRQEKFDFAEHHFRRAFQINRSSSIIMCYLGMALHQLKRNGDALEMIEKAITADRKNPLPVYQKASILLSLGRCEEALENLEQVKEFAPHESGIYALIAKIYKRLNMHDKAMFYFGIALDLKPPATDIATIKSAMEKLNLPDEFEDTMYTLALKETARALVACLQAWAFAIL